MFDDFKDLYSYLATGVIGAGAMWLKGRNAYSRISGNTEAIDAMRSVMLDLKSAYEVQRGRVDGLEENLISERARCHEEISSLREVIEGLRRDALIHAEMDKAGREGTIERRNARTRPILE